MPTVEKNAAIERRIREAKGGLGYLAACDAKGVPPKVTA
jgi:hypothetical protein